MQNNGPHDKPLNDELEDLGKAYQQLEPEDPPELLDQAILNSAHRAVEKKAGWMDFGWVHGLTTAAVVVLALTIILTQRQPPDLDESGLSPTDGRSYYTVPIRDLKPDELRRKQPGTATENKEEVSKDVLQDMPATRELEQDMAQANSPAKAMVAEQSAAAPTVEAAAIEPGLAKIGTVETDTAKADADKFAAKQLQPPTAEAQLQAILLLKQAGNDEWKDQLKAFIERYPDYPLPDELKN